MPSHPSSVRKVSLPGARPRLLTVQQAAERLGLAPHTLNIWRCSKRYGLAYVKVGRAVRYREADVERFIETGLRNATSESLL